MPPERTATVETVTTVFGRRAAQARVREILDELADSGCCGRRARRATPPKGLGFSMLTTILVVFVCCFLLERALPGWPLPRVRTWPLRVLVVNAVQLGVVLLAGLSWERWLSSASLFRLSDHVSPAVGGLLAYFIATFVFYWWHRWRHEVDLLWRGFHQIHHSPQRLEVITSFYKHPGEMVANSILGSLLVYTLLGLSLEAGAVYTLCTALGEFFYHTNVKTPRWVGFVFQRPEMHRIHHQHGRHKNNYGDITWWDMLFGTYENPKEWVHTCGFDDAKEQQLLAMLAYKDVHEPG
jgi:sterol desaturase/sphingolipid hydroxylase (fatty acid hydroxylase superfamily)